MASSSFCRLTVTDSGGATDSTTAVLMVSSAVDHPPVANARPNQAITLPQNSICLNGNWNSDDHPIVLYEWSLGPGTESKEVAMQASSLVCLQTLTCLSVHLPALPTVYPSVHQATHPPTHAAIHLPAHPSIHPSIGTSVHLFISSHIYLPTYLKYCYVCGGQLYLKNMFYKII